MLKKIFLSICAIAVIAYLSLWAWAMHWIDEEKNIVLGKHIFRYDSPSNLLRSVSSRQMAEKARLIKPNNVIERKCGCISIDNELYKRYSGEMEVVLKDKEADERVNVVGYINNDDLYKLSAYKDGMSYDFIEEKEGE